MNFCTSGFLVQFVAMKKYTIMWNFYAFLIKVILLFYIQWRLWVLKRCE